MRNIFQILTLLILITLLTVVLTKNKRAIQFEVDQAKTAIDSIPVTTLTLRLDSVVQTLQAVGKVKSADEVYVVSQTPGEITSVFVKIGESVKKGDILVKIDDFYARQEYEMAKKAHDQLKKDYLRYADLAGAEAIPRQQLEQLRLQLDGAETKMNSLEKRLNDYIIKAPVGGTVNQIFVSKGNSAGMGTPVCEIIGGTYVRIEASLNPDQVAFLHVGLKAVLSADFGHGATYRAQLTEIGERAGKLGGIAAIFNLIPDEKKSPETGSIVNILIEIKGEPQLLLPRRALTSKDGVMGLFVVQQNNRVDFTPVKYLDFDDSRIKLIENGLDHARIVVEGNNLLKTGDLVTVLN